MQTFLRLHPNWPTRMTDHPFTSELPFSIGMKNEASAKLAPHPGLSEGKRRAIELDYAMSRGELKLECRQALLFYTLKRLGLNSPMTASPEASKLCSKIKQSCPTSYQHRLAKQEPSRRLK